MRLIDADKIPWTDLSDGDGLCFVTFIEKVNRMPTIDARPTGEWVRCKKQNKADLDNGNALYECSNCGHTDLHAETQEVPYCWYCGADMRGDDDV